MHVAGRCCLALADPGDLLADAALEIIQQGR
jgi:hypothetical protein